jgi:hypothetical protein
MFSDEKLFTVNGGLNKKNDVIYAESRDEANRIGGRFEKCKFPLSVMVWCGITVNGPTEPFFVENQEKITSSIYINKILPLAKEEGNRLFNRKKWAYQQDGATAHTANATQNWCNKNLDHFITKDKWPPNSPDLNPLDYYFWNAVVNNMKKINFNSKDAFKNEIKAAIKRVPLEAIKTAIDSFTKRVREVENLNGNYLTK